MSNKKGNPRNKRRSVLATSGDPQSDEDDVNKCRSLLAAPVDPQSDVEDNELDENTYDDALDGSDHDDIREDGPWEASSPPTRLSAAEGPQLRAELALLQDRFASMRFDHRAAASTGNDAHRQAVWKPGSIRGMPSDTPSMDKPGSVLLFRRLVFDWLGA